MENIFEIRQNEELGRYMVAGRDIPARTLIVKEKPMACAPADDDRGSSTQPHSDSDSDSDNDNDDNDKDNKKTDLDPHADEQEQERAPMCLGCFTRQTHCPQSRCDRCGWPVCCHYCSRVYHHAENECRLFQKNSTPYPPPHTWPILYKSILVLRSYLLKSKSQSKSKENLKTNLKSRLESQSQSSSSSFQINDDQKDNKITSEDDGTDDYTEMMKFENHNELRWKKPDCVRNDQMIIANIKHFFRNRNKDEDDEENHNQDQDSDKNKLKNQNENKNQDDDNEVSIDETEILRISGIINVNAFTTLKQTQKGQVAIIQCLFKISTLISHSCVPNATWTIGDGPSFKMTIRAAVNIRKGQMITIAYSVRENLSGTLQRLVSTEEVAHFICRCPRCIDPTELGTMVSAVKCSGTISCRRLDLDDKNQNVDVKVDEEKEKGDGSNSTQCPGYLLPVNPTDSTSIWRCTRNQNQCQNQGQVEGQGQADTGTENENGNKRENQNQTKCKFSVPVQKIVRILCRVETQLENIRLKYSINYRHLTKSSNSATNKEKEKKENPDLNFLLEMERLREKCGKMLHQNHYLIQEISLNIVKRQATRFLNSISDPSENSQLQNLNLNLNPDPSLNEEHLENFIEHCKFLLKIANITSPGYCRHRAILQFYISRGLHRQARRKIHSNSNSESISESVPESKLSKSATNCVSIDLEYLKKMLSTFKCIDEFEREAFLYFQMYDDCDGESVRDEDRHRSDDPVPIPIPNCNTTVNSNNLYYVKLTEQMLVTREEIDNFQSLIDSYNESLQKISLGP